LFAEARRNQDLGRLEGRALGGEIRIWLILGATGIASMILSAVEATERVAPILYATLPLSIGLFVWRYDWEGKKAAATE
jgi:hypothetical protein